MASCWGGATIYTLSCSEVPVQSLGAAGAPVLIRRSLGFTPERMVYIDLVHSEIHFSLGLTGTASTARYLSGRGSTCHTGTLQSIGDFYPPLRLCRPNDLKLWRDSIKPKALLAFLSGITISVATCARSLRSTSLRRATSGSTATSKAPRRLAGSHPRGVVYGLKAVSLAFCFLSSRLCSPLSHARGVVLISDDNIYAVVTAMRVTMGPPDAA
ncbi:hypothetical protein BDZ89DRAFT_1150635 [Hymenopellis radicata]|nr:hypothetical protein BDZ89DRAFT_1150635 [Hymenopellis radicata]